MAGGGGEEHVSTPRERTVTAAGVACRVWEQGAGQPVTFLPGIGGLPRWSDFLDALARGRRVIAPSLPGFPGSAALPELDDQLDWLLATHDLLRAAGGAGGDLVAVSVGAALAADVAAVWPDAVRRLVLVSPLGLFDAADPSADIFAQPAGELGTHCCAAMRATSTPTWPCRTAPTAWSGPCSRYAPRRRRPACCGRSGTRAWRAACIASPSQSCWCSARTTGCCRPPTRLEVVAGAGHLVDLDAPQLLAHLVEEFLGS